MKKDSIFAKPMPFIKQFSFDSKVADVFPDMIKRSVPGYQQILHSISLFAHQFAQANSNIYDLGCSHGAAILAVSENLPFDNCKIIGVDNSKAMLDHCKKNLANLQNLELVCDDIENVKIENASIVILNFTMQFLPVKKRLLLLKNIYQGLNKGGILIISEKIKFNNLEFNNLMQLIHQSFKLANGYSSLEVSQKRTALENVLIADSLPTLKKRLNQAGFVNNSLWFQYLNFCSIIAIK